MWCGFAVGSWWWQGQAKESWGSCPGFAVLGSRSTSVSFFLPAAIPAAHRTQNTSPQPLGEGFTTA